MLEAGVLISEGKKEMRTIRYRVVEGKGKKGKELHKTTGFPLPLRWSAIFTLYKVNAPTIPKYVPFPSRKMCERPPFTFIFEFNIK